MVNKFYLFFFQNARHETKTDLSFFRHLCNQHSHTGRPIFELHEIAHHPIPKMI